MKSLIIFSTATAITLLSPLASATIGGPACVPAFASQPTANTLQRDFRSPAYRPLAAAPAYRRYAPLPYAGPGYYSGMPGFPAPVMPGMGGFPGFGGMPGIGGFPTGSAPWGGMPWNDGPWGGAPWGTPYPLYPVMQSPAASDGNIDVNDEIIVADDAPDGPLVPVDTDQDGVFNNADLCPDTAPTTTVDGLGCAMDAAIVLEGVNFHTDSATLTDESIAILDGVAATLVANPGVKVEVAGHTDSDAADDYNLTLSQSRAETVVAYLSGHGVSADAMTAKGYGESQPLAANDSPEHKASNRRVELRRL